MKSKNTEYQEFDVKESFFGTNFGFDLLEKFYTAFPIRAKEYGIKYIVDDDERGVIKIDYADRDTCEAAMNGMVHEAVMEAFMDVFDFNEAQKLLERGIQNADGKSS